MGKLIIFSAPSGSGKTTIVRELLRRIPQLEFSISATSRAPRGTERDGVDYYFLSPDEFRRAVDEERFVEWEEVYAGTCYGTLRSELDRIWGKGHTILFDVDVLGGINLKPTPAPSSSCRRRSRNWNAGSNSAAPMLPR